ncbi:hypothetical protein BH09MYX1_BH09MYX1_34640 [soil metagenome]
MRRFVVTFFFVGVSIYVLGACATGLIAPIPDPDGGTTTDASTTKDAALVCEAGCATGEVCSQGQCKLNCNASETKCGVTCVDAKTDPKNCGKCGNVCGTGFSCAAGVCAIDCGTKSACGSTDDGGADAGLVCVDIKTDPLNCGACGKDCSALPAPANGKLGCVAGACAVTSCDPGFADCNKTLGDGCEVNTNTDKTNCGKCGTVCGSGTPVCGQGTCIATACGNSVIDSGEKCDGTVNVPAGGQISCRAPGATNECKLDFSNVPQLYCTGTCSWGGAQGCDQADADIFCKLKKGSSTSVATSFTTGVAQAVGGFPCPGGSYGMSIGTMPEYGVSQTVYYQATSLMANHGGGTVINSVVCTN